MATLTVRQIDPRAKEVTWTGLDDGESGEAFSAFAAADRSVQVTGTVVACVFEGSNDPDPATGTWFTLTDPQGNPLSFSSPRLEQISEYTRWLRPRGTAGGSGMTVRMFVGT